MLVIVSGISLIAQGADTSSSEIEGAGERQLKINKEVLLTSPKEQIRDDAAMELLVHNGEKGREILIEVLGSGENTAAQQAVCRALIRARNAVGSTEEFIGPLMKMLESGDKDIAASAAESLAIYDYDQVGVLLRDLVRNQKLDVNKRLNAVYALQLRPDKEAMSELIRLLDDPDGKIAQAAEAALQEAFGYPVGTDKKVWLSILKDLPNKTRGEVLKERIASQIRRIAELEEEKDFWVSEYLASLDRIYETLDENGRASLLMDRLGSNYASVKLWALGKVSAMSSGTTASTESVGSALLGLISDPDRRVRLRTAEILSRMSEINPGSKLLEQLEKEPYEDVKLALFEALGEATYYAFSPGSTLKPPAELRAKTFDWAQNFLNSDQPEKVRHGAEVIRKLLELNGIPAEQSQKYLTQLHDRYMKARAENPQCEYCGQLLGVMARLCGQSSFKPAASELFREQFKEGLKAKEAEIRRAGATGLINIDKVSAFKLLVENGLYNDENTALRLVVIELAGNTGAAEDLSWLSERLNVNGDGAAAWDAFKGIIGRGDAATALEWAQKLREKGLADKYRELLLIAESKAEAEEKPDVLLRSKRELFDVYASAGEYAMAVERGAAVLAGVKDPAVKTEAAGSVVDCCLKGGLFAELASLIGETVTAGDINGENPLVKRIDEYLKAESTTDQSRAALVKALAEIETDIENRPGWAAVVRSWQNGALGGTVKEVAGGKKQDG